MSYSKSRFGLVLLISLSWALAGATVLSAQSPESKWILLDTARTSTMQKELQDAADRGYRLVSGQGSWPLTAILEKAEGNVEPIEYLLLATSRTRTMQKEMNQAAVKGYRFASVLGVGHEVVIAMQREKGKTTRTHEQKLLATIRIRTLKKELFAALGEGFRFVGQTVFEHSFTVENVAILERPVEGNAIKTAGDTRSSGERD
jgi:hypothetical protein